MTNVPRSSPYPLVPMSEALQTIHNSLHALPSVTLPLSLALNSTLASSIHAPFPHPPFRASIKDGYAIVHPVHSPPHAYLRVIGESVAGTAQAPIVLPAQAVYVTTGAPIPEGADTVVMVENTKEERPGYISIDKYPEPGADIREVGTDIKKDQIVVEKGSILGAAEIGLLAMCGIDNVPVVKRVCIGVLSSGDELVDVEKVADILKVNAGKLPGGKIIDSNRPMLLNAVRESLPFCEVTDLGIVHDDYETVRNALQQALEKCDIVITTGGVSMGNRDVIKPVLEEIATVHFGRVLMKPGKPLTFATVENRCVIALPGNPVSAFVCFHLAVCVAARTLAGWEDKSMGSWIKVKLGSDVRLDKQRPEYHRVVLEWSEDGFVAQSTGKQASSRLLSARSANALLELPAREGTIEAGEMVKAILLGSAR